jgi:eukaryotic-like serine/threonine-protein kinase
MLESARGSQLPRRSLTPGNPTRSHLFVVTEGVASQDGPFALEGTVFDGRFRIEERIAEGGFAIVYKAYQVALDRWVALKVLKAPRGHDEVARAEFREKFASEARTIARLQHPHIVEVYDFSVATLPSGEPAPWMALQWLEGETLATHLGLRNKAGQSGLPPREAVDFFRPAIQALAHAHKQGIVHRDIKPANIMVTKTPGGPSLRVLDFGISKIMADDQAPTTGQTRTESAPAFSPAYAAPEQVTFSRTGPWTDVHALGLILTELMTDAPPFSDPDPEAHMFEQVMAPRRPTPASKGRNVGPFEPIIGKALALSPRDRWRNAGELLEALESALAGGTADSAATQATAGPPSVDTIAEVRQQPRSRKPLGAIMLALAAAAVIGVVGWGIGAKRGPPEVLPSSRGAGLTTAVRPLRTSLIEPVAPPAPSTQVVPLLPSPPTPITASAAVQPTPEPTARSRPPHPAIRRTKRPASAPAPQTHARDLFDDTD